jgi:pyruvate formate lyase activating enzyme
MLDSMTDFFDSTPAEGHAALLAEPLSRRRVRCLTCIRRCVIPQGGRRWCHTRENRDGRLYSLIYGRTASISLNPIEKKPVFHFLPGTRWLSLGSLGCNFRCPGCQNWELAHADLDRELRFTRYLSPEELVTLALREEAAGISWTFNEPALWLEYILDTAPLAHKHGLFTNIVTNGALTLEAVDSLGPHLDVYRADIKGYFPKAFKILAGLPPAAAAQIRAAAVRARRRWNIWVEIVTNVIPGVNDDEATLKAIADWIKTDLGPDTPWHLTRFHPAYQMPQVPATPLATLAAARELAVRAGLHFVYLGNVPGHPAENTFCPQCGCEVISRQVFSVTAIRLKDGICEACGRTIPGRWQPEGGSAGPAP